MATNGAASMPYPSPTDVRNGVDRRNGMAHPAAGKRRKPMAPQRTRPKRPLTAYLVFMQEKRAEVAVAHPELDFGGIGRYMGQLWAALTPAERKAYEAKATVDQRRYAEAMTAYGEELAAAPSAVGQRQAPEASRRARTSYNFFMTAVRPIIARENPTLPFGEVGRLVGERWNALTPEERRPFVEMAIAEKRRLSGTTYGHNGPGVK